MKIEKIRLDEIYRAYSVGYVTIDHELNLIVASEAIDGACYAYSGDHFQNKKVVWEKAGGTMSIVPVPNTNGEFLATQNFFPGFNAKTSKVVHVIPNGDSFIVKDVLELPYLHRFDLLEVNGHYYFIGATLCSSKTDREDWSDPGKVYVGEFTKDLTKVVDMRPIYKNLTHNHGYYQADYQGKKSSYITADEGVFVFTPPQNDKDKWHVNQLINTRVSDVAVLDINQDGEDEILAIEPFHGPDVYIYQKINGKYQRAFTVERKMEFVHAIAGANLRGQLTFVCGVRRNNQELFYLSYNKNTHSYDLTMIDENVGTANIAIINEKGRDLILAANNTIHEAAVYIIS